MAARRLFLSPGSTIDARTPESDAVAEWRSTDGAAELAVLLVALPGAATNRLEAPGTGGVSERCCCWGLVADESGHDAVPSALALIGVVLARPSRRLDIGRPQEARDVFSCWFVAAAPLGLSSTFLDAGSMEGRETCGPRSLVPGTATENDTLPGLLNMESVCGMDARRRPGSMLGVPGDVGLSLVTCAQPPQTGAAASGAPLTVRGRPTVGDRAPPTEKDTEP